VLTSAAGSHPIWENGALPPGIVVLVGRYRPWAMSNNLLFVGLNSQAELSYGYVCGLPPKGEEAWSFMVVGGGSMHSFPSVKEYAPGGYCRLGVTHHIPCEKVRVSPSLTGTLIATERSMVGFPSDGQLRGQLGVIVGTRSTN